MFNLFVRSRLEQLVPQASADNTFYLQALQVEYLLKELEFQVAIEDNARDRAEQMVSYLLTAIAAILGAVLLIMQTGENYLLISFIASLLIWIFSAFSFHRVCRLRNAITHARLHRRLIRGCMEQIGISQVADIVAMESQPTGFSPRAVLNLILIGVVSSLAAGITVAMGCALFLIDLVRWPVGEGGNRYVGIGIAASLVFGVSITVHMSILGVYFFNSKHLIRDFFAKDGEATVGMIGVI